MFAIQQQHRFHIYFLLYIYSAHFFAFSDLAAETIKSSNWFPSKFSWPENEEETLFHVASLSSNRAEKSAYKA
jgi:hypothetical protein